MAVRWAKQLGLSAFAAVCLAGVTAAEDTPEALPNPWGDTLLKYNIPYIHGSGVYVDLGNQKMVKNRSYREPAGLCPVVGKVISLDQPTTDAAVWPHDFLERVPLAGTSQDTSPLGGGFGMWETEPVKISPLTLAELQAMAEKQKAKNKPDSPETKKLLQVEDDLGLCAWWAWATYAPNGSTDLESKYRYPFVWDEEKKGPREDGAPSSVLATLWPVGALGEDQPDSRGVGINYANWSSGDGTCEMFDTIPTCLLPAPQALSFTSLGSADPNDAELPPCTAASEGWKVPRFCECDEAQQNPWVCENGEWTGGSEECECSNALPLALGLSVGLLVPVAAIAAYFFFRRQRQNSPSRPSEKKRLLSEDRGEEEFSKVEQRRNHKRSDLLQEAEPSFWGETQQDQTNVVIDENAHEAYY
ncbi:apical membrane antigen, putative [Eimeria brunetti]|uniref:Apical membrane antigen, putative n=1 Tax=Eimeria brunetti TaxID=51314 RepID=U6LXP7_9EIME|nr:apical membrane antigen, putative [Eimeria brunetti]